MKTLRKASPAYRAIPFALFLFLIVPILATL